MEAGKVSACAGKGCVGSDAMLEETVVEAVVEATPAVEAEAVEMADVVFDTEPPAAPLALELLAICWNLPSRRL